MQALARARSMPTGPSNAALGCWPPGGGWWNGCGTKSHRYACSAPRRATRHVMGAAIGDRVCGRFCPGLD